MFVVIQHEPPKLFHEQHMNEMPAELASDGATTTVPSG